MTETPPTPARSKRIYVLWGVALAVLLTVGLVCWLVVVPVWQVRRVLRDVGPDFVIMHLDEPRVTRHYEAAVQRLGGPRRAAEALSLYSRLPAWVGENRDIAVYLLGWCDASAVPALIGALRDQDEHVRWMAAIALCQLGPEAREALPALVTALEDEDELVRMSSASALGQLRVDTGQVVPALTRALSDTDDAVRVCAADSLGEIGPDAKEAVPCLGKLLRDKVERVRVSAAEALWKIAGEVESSRRVLEAASDSDNKHVRQAAAEALKRIRAAQEKAVSDVLIYSSSNLSGHAVAPEWLGGDKATEQDVKLRSLKTHGEVISNPKRRNVYVNAIGHKKFVERFPSGKPLRLGRYRYAAHVQLPLSPKPEVKQKTNPQAVHTMIQFWDGRNALYKSNKTTLEGAIYWDIDPWTAQEFGKIKVYTHPVKLVDTGIRLRPDTSWHRFELVIDLEAQRYVSVTIDDQTRDLSNMRLARVKHADWGRDVALTITTESLASWSKDAGAAFTWTTRFRDISFFEDRPASSDLPNQPDSGDADVR